MRIPDRRRRGFTLLEASISLAVLGLLLTSVFSMTLETMSFVGDNETDTVLQSEAHRAVERMTDILRKSGRAEVAGVEYPRVVDGGTALEFLMLTDLDGNGYPFEADTGSLEWGDTVYSIRANAGGSVHVYRGTDQVYFLGRFLDALSFRTVEEDPSLQLKEIRIAMNLQKSTKGGAPLSYNVRTSVHMRN